MVADAAGSISAEPAIIEEMAARFLGVAGNTGSVRGSMSGVAAAAGGCAGSAAASYARLQSLLDAALNGLDYYSLSLGRATSSAAAAYVATDGGVFSPIASDCPAVP
jgi:uncharacterized protein YukE